MLYDSIIINPRGKSRAIADLVEAGILSREVAERLAEGKICDTDTLYSRLNRACLTANMPGLRKNMAQVLNKPDVELERFTNYLASQGYVSVPAQLNVHSSRLHVVGRRKQVAYEKQMDEREETRAEGSF